MDNTQQLALVNKLTGLSITEETMSTPEFVEQYNYLMSLTRYLEDVKRNVDEAIKQVVKEHYFETGENSMATPEYRYTYVPATTRETFNTKTFKSDHPETYREYVKVSDVADSIRLTKLKSKNTEISDVISD
ncbi:MAG: hypothetical protein J6S67_23480 [Methanobrevibacter sp.]|nr:hypothetical protein [Methanobrevibacter sp.]